MSTGDLLSTTGMGLVGIGVLWEHLRGPSLPGWAAIVTGWVLLLLPRRRLPVRTPSDWPLLLLAAMGGVSLLITAIPETTRVQVTRLWADLVIFYALVNWARERRRLTLATIALVTGGVGIALLAPVAVDWNRAKMVLIPAAFYEPFPLLLPDPVHPNVMAALMVLLLPMPLALLISPGAGRRFQTIALRLLLGLSVLLMGLILLLTKSRGGYIAGAVGGLLVVTLSVRTWWLRILVVLLVVAVVGAGVWWFVHADGDTGNQPELLEGVTDPSTWDFRRQVWRTAVLMLQDFPFTGAGMGLFNEVGALLYAWYAPQNPGAHNLYLQVGVDLGFPGLIAYLSILILTLHAAAKSLHRLPPGDPLHSITLGGLAGLVALMTHGLVDITVWSTRAAFLPWLVLGLLTALHHLDPIPDAE